MLFRTEWNVNNIFLSTLITHLQGLSHTVIYRIEWDISTMSDFEGNSTASMENATRRTSMWGALETNHA